MTNYYSPYKNYKKAKKRKYKRYIYIIILLIFIFTSSTFVRHNIKKYSQEYAQAFAKSKVIEVVNNCTSQVLEKKEVFGNYDKFVNIEKDSDNNVTYIGLNMLLVNLLVCDLAQTSQAQINLLCDNEFVKMPLGAMFGTVLFAEYGPIVNISINPIGHVVCNFYNRFENVGINNTMHELYAEIIVDIEIMFPLYTEKQTLDFEFIIFQNLIVGKIPDFYINSVGKLKSNSIDLLP